MAKPTSVNGVPYDQWVNRKIYGKSEPVKVTQTTVVHDEQESFKEDLDMIKATLNLPDETSLFDVLQKISDLMQHEHRLGDTDEDRLTPNTSDIDATTVQQSQGTGGPDYIDTGDQ